MSALQISEDDIIPAIALRKVYDQVNIEKFEAEMIESEARLNEIKKNLQEKTIRTLEQESNELLLLSNDKDSKELVESQETNESARNHPVKLN